jgi:hypothetical protein
MKTQPINVQTLGPLVEEANRISAITPNSHKSVCGVPKRVSDVSDEWEHLSPENAANARLLRAGFNAFDKAGRELGIDAATLAERIDLAELIRAANRVVVSSEVKDCGPVNDLAKVLNSLPLRQ